MYYTNREMQAVSIARLIHDDQIAVVGTGLPLIGASIAKRLFAPTCHLIVESGIMDCNPKEVPTSVADCRLMANGSVLWDQYRYFGFQTNSMRYENIDLLAFIGGAQIDPYGNVNSTCIGDYHQPKTRFTGSGGANGIATFFNTVIMMQHEKRRFVKSVDYLTSPGWIDGPDGRKKSGLPSNRGPQAVVTDLGIMKFDDQTKRMYVDQYYPGVSLDQIIENTGFDIDVSRARQADPPSRQVIELIRTEVDPHKVFIKY
ncbi:CoA-transferase [Acidaminobacter sp. JC074]|uniref:CoA-transferase subunit beta n=1 Tax=Acidaminobacter sp. JC074 TaxID=2530199 RepID=UPI002ED18DA0